MALDDLLARLQSESVTPAAPQKNDGVTPQTALLLAATPVTLVTPPKAITDRKTASPAQNEKPLPVTMEHFRAQGVELLANDLAFLLWHLPKGTAVRNNAINAYIKTWQAAMAGESMVHKKANRGRFAANTWLRERGV